MKKKKGGEKSQSKQPMTVKKKLAGMKIWQLLVLLLVVVCGAVLFVGAVSGWFSGEKVVLDVEYYCNGECEENLVNLSKEEYEDLIENKKSFIVFVDQSGCKTADKLRSYVSDWTREKGVMVYRMMFSDAKGTSLHDFVKYYPSVVVISNGKIVGYLRADEDEDAAYYNDYEEFKGWISAYF